ncbi:MAG: serine/threonine protein kinase [Myxococcales bacterium]|nr:serine/threonine protein kinase [Myxococcales bacterium]
MTRLKAEAPPGLSLSNVERKHIGRYEIIKTLGKGAMGVVYKALDPALDRIVAVKTIMSPQSSGRRVRSAFLERFQREAKAAAKMQHPAIVTIFDVGLDDETGAPFMVLEYLPGESLADRLDRVRLSLGKAVQISLDLASALSFAHNQRIVHRDVKPANVLHAGENRWKLADFGIARMPDSDLTQVGIFMGTPGYSPPEAIREGRYTPQADVFAWGAVLYELMSGRIPYEGPDTKTTNSYVVQGNALPPTRHDSSIPEPLSAVCMRALQSSAEHRFRDGAEAEAALREAWDRCLLQSLVHPAVLAMEEMPHDKVPAQMHVPRGTGAPAMTGASAGRPPAPVAHVAPGAPAPKAVAGAGSGVRPIPAAQPAAEMSALEEAMSAIERMSDDDPTMIMSREELAARRDGPRRSAPMPMAQPPPPSQPIAPAPPRPQPAMQAGMPGMQPPGPPYHGGGPAAAGPVLTQGGYQGAIAHDVTVPTPRPPGGFAPRPSPPPALRPPQARPPARAASAKPWIAAAIGAGLLLVVLVTLLALGVI